MGYSKNVLKILETWRDASIENSGIANVWYVGNKEYKWEASKKESTDGSIYGTIFRCNIGEVDKKATGSFRIDNDGTVIRAPTFLRKASGRVEAEMALELLKVRAHKEE